jgi:hypothetical protein
MPVFFLAVPLCAKLFCSIFFLIWYIQYHHNIYSNFLIVEKDNICYNLQRCCENNGRRLSSRSLSRRLRKNGGDDHDGIANHFDFVNLIGFDHKKLTAPAENYGGQFF